MTSWFDGDEQLLEELGIARSETSDPAPVGMLMVGYDMVFADAIDAVLLHDSDVDELAAIRSDLAGARMLTFAADGLQVEFELIDGRVVGHIEPPQDGAMILEQPSASDAPASETTPDDLGSFEFPLRHPATFRLRFVRPGADSVATGWIDGPHQTLS